ncbi:sugar phosphate isomerase/epimerase family protein [Halorientalis regularis]|uniref:Sugar phosphate isomerase/epimerase n=1 Tax=Halorientalis regularis TaxID=660518 RepID=A0A1G7SZN7_9EURY|nr:sugar phosphate isomerase/epimerase [Halorientalis regularis]SDG28527.1 Sugar phosphate isomerase/epimerase [Halorientalis regularis]
MDIGVSVGPYVDRIDELPGSFSFVEVAIGEGERPVSALDPAALSERLTTRGFGATVHLPYRQPLATTVERIDSATLEYFDTLLAAAAAMGADTAVAHPRSRGSGRDHLADRMGSVVDRAEEHGVTVCFETVGHAGGVALEQVGELAAEAGAAVCLDVGYAYLEAGTEGTTAFLDSYGDIVDHLHVHGARHRRDTHIPVGSGDVDYATLGPALADAAPTTATVEVFTDDPGYLTSSAERFTAALDGVSPEDEYP